MSQLSKEQRAAYSPTSREKNKAVKEALDNDFTSKFNKSNSLDATQSKSSSDISPG
jgi:hypothetical protein